MKLTSKEVKRYMLWRSDTELGHCPDCIAAACNDSSMIFNYDAKELMKLVFFNDPIPALHTHNYGFHTATGRNIIQTIQEFYHEYKNLEL